MFGFIIRLEKEFWPLINSVDKTKHSVLQCCSLFLKVHKQTNKVVTVIDLYLQFLKTRAPSATCLLVVNIAAMLV